jgi:rod shape-determining protein MreC
MKAFSPQTIQIVAVALIIIGIIVLALAGYLGPVFGVAMDPFLNAQQWISERYLTIVDFLTVPRDVQSLHIRNAELENEVSRLQSQVIQLQQQLGETQILYALLDFARARPENQYIAAAVIGRDPSPFLHYIIIDHGSDDGILHGMPVVTEQGLVGRVDAVTAGAARVQLITDPGSVVNIRFESLEAEALLTGSVTGEVSLEMIPQELNLQQGEIVLTSGLGGAYPLDILVGQVTSIRQRQNDLFQTAVVQPVVAFDTLRAVLVIRNWNRPLHLDSLG